MPVNLPGTSPVCCNLELQASEAYPYAVAPFHSVRPRDGPCVPRECTLDTPTPDINCRRSWGVHLNSSSSCSSGCPSCSFPLTSMAVTVRSLSVVGWDVIRLPYFQSCSSAPDVDGRGKLQVSWEPSVCISSPINIHTELLWDSMVCTKVAKSLDQLESYAWLSSFSSLSLSKTNFLPSISKWSYIIVARFPWFLAVFRCGGQHLPHLPYSQREIFSDKDVASLLFASFFRDPFHVLVERTCATAGELGLPLSWWVQSNSLSSASSSLSVMRSRTMPSQSCEISLSALGIPRKMRLFLLDWHTKSSVFPC